MFSATRTRKHLSKISLTVAAFCMCVGPAHSQAVTIPRTASPLASVTQTIGISTISVTYSRPSVNGRKIWGAVVLYGKTFQPFGSGNPAPWRAGANENTTITLSHPARVEGVLVPAGTYGLFFVVENDNTAEVILSRDFRSWGSFYYDSTADQMSARVKTRDHAFTEPLTYDFINLSKASAELVLNWEQKQIPVHIEFDVDSIVIENAKAELKGSIGFTADGYISAAFYSFQNNIDLPQAMEWIDHALALEPNNFEALRVKSRILIRNGKSEEANKLIDDALLTASESDISNYGYQLIALGLNEKAIKVLMGSTKRFPKSANAWDSLGEAYMIAGDKKNALPCFKKSLSLNPSPAVRANSEKYLKQLAAM